MEPRMNTSYLQGMPQCNMFPKMQWYRLLRGFQKREDVSWWVQLEEQMYGQDDISSLFARRLCTQHSEAWTYALHKCPILKPPFQRSPQLWARYVDPCWVFEKSKDAWFRSCVRSLVLLQQEAWGVLEHCPWMKLLDSLANWNDWNWRNEATTYGEELQNEEQLPTRSVHITTSIVVSSSDIALLDCNVNFFLFNSSFICKCK